MGLLLAVPYGQYCALRVWLITDAPYARSRSFLIMPSVGNPVQLIIGHFKVHKAAIVKCSQNILVHRCTSPMNKTTPRPPVAAERSNFHKVNHSHRVLWPYFDRHFSCCCSSRLNCCIIIWRPNGWGSGFMIPQHIFKFNSRFGAFWMRCNWRRTVIHQSPSWAKTATVARTRHDHTRSRPIIDYKW